MKPSAPNVWDIDPRGDVVRLLRRFCCGELSEIELANSWAVLPSETLKAYTYEINGTETVTVHSADRGPVARLPLSPSAQTIGA